MARAFDRPIHLFLFVKVRENWTEDPERYRGPGLPALGSSLFLFMRFCLEGK
jgi:hypothetical protein